MRCASERRSIYYFNANDCKILFPGLGEERKLRLVTGPMLFSRSLRYRISFSYGTEVLQKIPRRGNQKTMRLPIEWRRS
jgi:hypothetical protein